MPTFFGSGNAAVSCFEIRVDEDHLVLRGSPSEAPSVLLKGTLVLCTSEPIRTSLIRLTFAGDLRAGFINAQANYRSIKQEARILKQEQTIFTPGKQEHGLKPGNHEWDFEFLIQGDQHESVEGLPYSWIIYRLKAVVERGMLAKDLVTKKHIRLIRTFEPTSLALFQAMSVDNLWPDKIKYTLSTPSKAVIFGSTISCDFVLIPLLKGLKVGKILSQLWEETEFHMMPTTDLLVPRKHEYQTMVAEDSYQMPDDAETEDIDGLEGYRLSRDVQMPRNLRKCLQTVDTHVSYPMSHPVIRIKHHMKFVISLLNPAGHTSELRCKLPVHIFLSPNLRLNDSQELVSNGALVSSTSLASESLPPPGYGEHVFDQIYSDIPTSIYSPAASGLTTPRMDLSSHNSDEDLASLDQNANEQLSANTLHNRLSNLVNPTSSRWNSQHAGDHAMSPPIMTPAGNSEHASRSATMTAGAAYFTQRPGGSSNGSPTADGAASAGLRTPGGASGMQTPIHLEFNKDELTRVPSYNTAMHTPRTHLNSNLPTYTVATSRPPSPPSPDTLPLSAADERPHQSTRRVRYASGTHD